MIPLRDENPTSRIPFVTILLILVNVTIFGYELSLPEGEIDRFIRTWGFVPGKLLEPAGLVHLRTLFTSMFLHGGLLHLGGNMLYLWVFGDNVEEELGHVSFLVFYLLAGVLGSTAQFLVHPASEIPMVGASGAIAGVLGAYLLLYPNARVLTAVIIIIFVRLMYLPAWLLLGFWIFLQFFNGTASLGLPSGGGVAWFAHIGGFLAGGVVIFLLKFSRLSRR